MKTNKKMKKKILIIGHLDGLANSVRPKVIKKFLEKNGYNVRLLNDKDSLFLKAKESYKMIARKRAKKKPLLEYYRKYPFIEDREASAEIVLFYLQKDKYDVIICHSPPSSYIFNKKIDCLKIYDCPAPIPFELEYGYEFAKKSKISKNSYINFYAQFHPEYIRELKRRELEIYKNVDYLCFHWQSYAEYIKKHFYRGDNMFTLNWGCSIKRKRAQWNSRPKIIYLGNLKSYWVNIELLSFLTKTSPYPIDCYGRLKPEKCSHLNFKEFLPNMDMLSQYQFGLVTITKDELRKSGFSAKALDYVSYGLPTLLPKWYTIKPNIGGCIYYDESDFISQIKVYLDRNKWEKKSDEAYEYAQQHSWDKILSPLLQILNKSLR